MLPLTPDQLLGQLFELACYFLAAASAVLGWFFGLRL
jgi:hypothetical protein